MPASKKVTSVEIRMYKMGTGDCFILKFLAGKKVAFKMMIDCGTWQGSSQHLKPYIKDLLQYVDNQVDILVVTHEHKDHVHVFDACRKLFVGPESKLQVDRIWMAWTENDKNTKVRKWKTEYGDKKKALAAVSEKYSSIFRTDSFAAETEKEFNGNAIVKYKRMFAAGLNNFAELHLDAAPQYVGPLKGMNVVKTEIANNNIEYFSPGDIIDDLPGTKNVKMYVLGPPLTHAVVTTEKGPKGETYDHNTELAKSNAFAAAILNVNQNKVSEDLLPFDHAYVEASLPIAYQKQPWRKIDHDWLNSGALLALRMNSITNNLSLAIAIEIGDNGDVLLFPGDAEFGSWNSWHTIKWNKTGKDPSKHFTEDLLNRTIFYKVAHHMSHNGTAKQKGLDMMTNRNLSAMATLDYDIISDGWKSTMPNRGILKDLLDKTQGRLVIMNEQNLFVDFKNKEPLTARITAARNKMSTSQKKEFKKNFVDTKLFSQLTLKV